MRILAFSKGFLNDVLVSEPDEEETKALVKRRNHPRYPVSFACSWESARVVEISAGGCYISCRDVPREGRYLELEIVLDGVALRVNGTVLYAQPGLGFGLRFGDLGEVAREQLYRCLVNRANS